MRKDRAKRGVENLDRALIDIICLQPLGEETAAVQLTRDGLVIFAGEEAGDAGAIRVRRLRSDDIVSLLAHEQQLARVAVEEVHVRIGKRVVVYRRALHRELRDCWL